MNGTDRNSLVSHLTGYLSALSKDIAGSYHRYSDWARDFSRLSHELEVRGSRLLTLDLPALGKHFDRCLDQGLYTRSGLPYGAIPRRGPQVPVLLRDLYLQVFDTEGKLRCAPNPVVIRHLRALFMGAKKIRLPFSDRSVTSEINDFIRIEREIQDPTLLWDEDYLYPSSRPSHSDLQSGWFGGMEDGTEQLNRRGEATRTNPHCRDTGPNPRVGLADLWELEVFPGRTANPLPAGPYELAVVQVIADRLASQFGDLFLEQATELPKHGPGAVAEGGRFCNKYRFPHWPRKLQASFPADLYASPRLGEVWESEGEIELGLNEPPARLIAVPKTQKGPRLIAAEPIAHQWTQQLVRNQLEGRLGRTLLRHSVSFRDQTLSQEMAQRGSIDGALATIDLSSASDRLSCWLVERMFRSNRSLLMRLHACRTRWLAYRYPHRKTEYIRLSKFAPMGSAVTFPVQSIIYAVIATAGVLLAHRRVVTPRSIEDAARQIRVFGDDIIVPKEAMKVVCDILTTVGLRVNADKTFGTGRFRESCGMDAWGGHDVTPPYLREPSHCSRLTRAGAALAVRNNYYRKGYLHVAEWLDGGLSRYQKWIPGVPFLSKAPGRILHTGADADHCQSRYNRRLQRKEIRVLLPVRKSTPGLSAGVHRIHQWFIEEPLPEIHWMSGWVEAQDVYVRPGWVPSDFMTNDLKRPLVPVDLIEIQNRLLRKKRYRAG